MHDRRVGGAENRPQFDRAARKANQFALVLAACLDWRAGLDALPAAERQNCVPKIRGRVAEPAAAAQDIQTLFAVHVGEARSQAPIGVGMAPHAPIIGAIAAAPYRLPPFATCPRASSSAAISRSDRFRPLTG
jgi:hypothetical protein